MNKDYSIQFLKLAGICFAIVAGLGFLLGLLLMGFDSRQAGWFVPLLLAGYGCYLAAIPVLIFTGFVITLRAFGRKS